MILVLLDEPGWFLYASPEDAVHDTEARDMADSLRAAFDHTGQAYAFRWVGEPRSAARSSDTYELVPHGPADATALVALLRAHPEVAAGSPAERRRFELLRRDGPRSETQAVASGDGSMIRWRRSLEASGSRERAAFPITVHWLHSGEEETFSDEEDLLCNVEDFDSADSDHRPARVRDARGREVHLTVRIWEDVSEAWVYGPEANPRSGPPSPP